MRFLSPTRAALFSVAAVPVLGPIVIDGAWRDRALSGDGSRSLADCVSVLCATIAAADPFDGALAEPASALLVSCAFALLGAVLRRAVVRSRRRPAVAGKPARGGDLTIS